MARSLNSLKRQAEKRFPHKIDMAVPPGGLGQQLDAMLAWCREPREAIGIAMDIRCGRQTARSNDSRDSILPTPRSARRSGGDGRDEIGVVILRRIHSFDTGKAIMSCAGNGCSIHGAQSLRIHRRYRKPHPHELNCEVTNRRTDTMLLKRP